MPTSIGPGGLGAAFSLAGTVVGQPLRKRLKIDDVLGVWPLHGIIGTWGGIAAGIFGSPLFGGMGGVSFLSQLAGSLLAVLYALAAGVLVYGIVRRAIGFRMSDEAEFAGPDLARCTTAGLDQRIKLFLPLAGQTEPVVPEGPDWYTDYRAMPEHVKPPMRTFTIRDLRAEAHERDVDFVLHGDLGPAQLLWSAGRPVLLDFDRCTMGDVALDLGSFLTQLRRITLRKPGKLPDFAAMRVLLLDAYARGAPADAGLDRRVTWYEAAVLLRKVHQLIFDTTRHPEADAIRRRREEASRLLEGVLPAGRPARAQRAS